MSNGASPVVWTRRTVPKPTVVFESYWSLAAERQRLFRARLLAPEDSFSTADPVLSTYRFTNAYRASDRVSQFLIRQVIYDSARSWRDTFIRTVLFKLFNKIATWELLTAELGEIDSGSFGADSIISVLDKTMAEGNRIYSAAYIMPCATVFGESSKHAGHIRLLEAMLADRGDEGIVTASSMAEAFAILASYPSVGPFLAYQFITDLNYSDHLDFTEDEFVMPGPGALDGIMKCFSDPGDMSPVDVIRWTMETQRYQFETRGLEFEDLWGRPLQLIDCQNLYCEVAKYARVAHPEIQSRTGRRRIKQRYSPQPKALTAWYPPKWGVNGNVMQWITNAKLAKGCVL